MATARERERRRAQSRKDVLRVGGVPDLSALKSVAQPIAEELASEMQIAAEMEVGMRCTGCRRRIRGRGFEFVRWRVVDNDGKPGVFKQLAYACAQDDCDYAQVIANEADAMRPLTPYVFLDEALGNGGPEEKAEPEPEIDLKLKEQDPPTAA